VTSVSNTVHHAAVHTPLAHGPVADSQTQKALDIEYHRKAAASYDRAVTRHFRFYHKYSLHPWVRKVVADRPNARILDMGTGTGVVACTLAGLGARVQAVDHSPDMLAVAEARAEAAGVADRVRFATVDCENLPYEDASFDAVTIQGVLHHLPDIAPMLRQAYRVLRPGGQIYISEPCIEGALVSRWVNAMTAPARLLKRAARRVLRAGPGDPNGSDHELPISGPKLIAAVRNLGMEVQAEYLVHLGIMRFFPEFSRIWITLAASLPTRHRHGDLIFLTARKVNVS
jgi:ubiquinone/menaquinone biosynthesis C-methylase UbiE